MNFWKFFLNICLRVAFLILFIEKELKTKKEDVMNHCIIPKVPKDPKEKVPPLPTNTVYLIF